jgi:hypothetical protein
VNMILRPDLCIVDAIVGQETPHGGKIHRIGVVIFGRARGAPGGKKDGVFWGTTIYGRKVRMLVW